MGDDATIRICMWSGPRNISTAMMRSWEARGDCAVLDEPFYAHYLRVTGFDHPGRDAIIERHEDDWRRVVEMCVGPVPGGKRIFYQKQMCHHMLLEIDLDWLGECRHAMLLRDPRRMLISLAKVIDDPNVESTGLPQQLRLYDAIVERTGSEPPVFDSRDILMDPPGALRAMCEALGVEYTDRMLSWEAGPRDSDGVWGPHWYANLYETTGFQAYSESHDELAPELEGVLEECQAIYERLTAHRTVIG
ncbi:MAG: HAD family hydrolase [Phycisphaerales bacterium JB043]